MTPQQPDLPALPAPHHYVGKWFDGRMYIGGPVVDQPAFTADQMRAYAQEAVLADRRAAARGES